MPEPIRDRSKLLGVCFLVFFLAQAAMGQDQSPDAKRITIADAGVQRTVGIYCSKEKYASFYGTGAVISPDGLVVTSTTVVPAGADEIKVVFAGPEIRDAKIVEVNEALEADPY